MKDKLIYLAQPYGHETRVIMQHRYGIAVQATDILMSKGLNVFSPILHNHPINVHRDFTVTGFEVWKNFDLLTLSKCDLMLVLMIAGWDKSIGVAAERIYAEQLGIRVAFVTMNDLEEWKDPRIMANGLDFIAYLEELMMESDKK